jgi:dipeptidyl aminopeptidase/acylaminoacyl peptidase
MAGVSVTASTRLATATIVFVASALCSALICTGSSNSQNSRETVPSHEFLKNPAAPDETVEYLWKKPQGEGPFPAVFFLHGHQEPGPGRIGARAFVNWGVLDDYARMGVIAVAISQPGYGESTGNPDFCGPKSQTAVKAVIDRFRRMKSVDSNRLGLEGISRGAVVAAMVATRESVSALVLISGVYDFDRLSRDSYWPLIADFRQETNSSKSVMLDRSALDHVKQIRAPTLILAGAKDPYAPAKQANEFAAALRLSNIAVELKIFPNAGHSIPLQERKPLVDAFLRKYLKF